MGCALASSSHPSNALFEALLNPIGPSCVPRHSSAASSPPSTSSTARQDLPAPLHPLNQQAPSPASFSHLTRNSRAALMTYAYTGATPKIPTTSHQARPPRLNARILRAGAGLVLESGVCSSGSGAQRGGRCVRDRSHRCLLAILTKPPARPTPPGGHGRDRPRPNDFTAPRRVVAAPLRLSEATLRRAGLRWAA